MRRNEFPFIAINFRLWDNNTLCTCMDPRLILFFLPYNTRLYYIELYSKQKIIRLLS